MSPVADGCSTTADEPKAVPDDVMTSADEAKASHTVALPADDRAIDSGATVEMDPATDRGEWGGQLEFLLTMIGFAVGLGNVWRFPYLAYQDGGGAFLIPFAICIVLVGFPVFLVETGLGQFCSLGPTSAWRCVPLFKGIGVAMVIVSTYVVLYYNVIVSWCIYFFFASMTNVLPWTYCGNWWNTPGCVDVNVNISSIINGTYNNHTVVSAAEEYYYRQVLRMSDGMEDMGGVIWQLAVLLLLAWTIIFLVLIKGVASLGKVSYFVALFPYVLLTIMLIQGALLPGAAKGMLYFITPVWEKLYDPKVWSDAVGQVFYSCSCCFGGLIAMASFNKFNYNVMRDAVLVPVVVFFTSVFAGLVVFSVLGYISEQQGIPIENVAQDGPGLVFVVYPEGLGTMPVAPLWSILFFFMMSTLGFSSQFSMSEGVCTAVIDEFPTFLRQGHRPMTVRFVFCTACFLLGLPMVTNGGFYLFMIMDQYTAGYPLLVIGVSEMMVLHWIYGFNNYADDMELMLGSRPNWYWRVMWCVVSPLLLLSVIIVSAIYQTSLTFGDYVYPGWANVIAWLIVAFPLSMYVLWVLGYWMSQGAWQVLKGTLKPLPNWGPASAKNRLGRYAPVPRSDGPADPEAEVASTPSTSKEPSQGPPAYENYGYINELCHDMSRLGEDRSANDGNDEEIQMAHL